MHTHSLSIACLVAVTAAVPGAASAFNLQPMSRVLAPSGSEATQSFDVVNDGRDRVAIVISIATLTRDENYVETNHDADDDFLVYPSQIVLGPGVRQTVRVTWLGTPRPARELAYRIIAEEVPIETIEPDKRPSRPSGQLRILMIYRGTLLVRPPNARPRVTIDGVDAVSGAGADMLAVTLRNEGLASGIVTRCAIRISAPDGRTFDLDATALASIAKTRILAGSRRRYLVTRPSSVAATQLTATGRCELAP